ncbi:MAG: hypothetical protein Q7J73_08775 [Dehalococcoidales bacterium]|nr:hypothetical protein [Dehalococcoidales bacterium]
MKRLVFIVMVGLLAMAILSVGCAKTTPAPAPAATTQNVTGTLKDLNTPDDPGKDVVTVTTPQGDKTFNLTADTTYSIEGRSCLLADVGKAVDEGNVTYECTVVLTGLTPYAEEQAALAIYVTKK